MTFGHLRQELRQISNIALTAYSGTLYRIMYVDRLPEAPVKIML
jgi:hypothetical protein